MRALPGIGLFVKRADFPEAGGSADVHAGIGADRRIEDVVEPLARFGEALVLHQPVGDQQRDMEIQLPVVEAVCPVRIELDLLNRVPRVSFTWRHDVAVGVIPIIERLFSADALTTKRAGVTGGRIEKARNSMAIQLL